MVLAKTQAVPLQFDQDGVIRVGETRVRLDTVVYAFNEGYTAEEIVSHYPALNLADAYAVIAYYLRNRETVDEYVRQRADLAASIRTQIEAKPEYKDFRERLWARCKEAQAPGK